MGTIQYSFGTGTGQVHTWDSAADVAIGAPVANAVGLDFDGDGRVDDALWDSNGDGVADIAALDLDDDGHYDAWFSDPSGTGVWNERVAGPVPAGGPGLPAVGLGVHVKDGVAELVVDSGEGQRVVLVDTDRDGVLDEWFPA